MPVDVHLVQVVPEPHHYQGVHLVPGGHHLPDLLGAHLVLVVQVDLDLRRLLVDLVLLLVLGYHVLPVCLGDQWDLVLPRMYKLIKGVKEMLEENYKVSIAY